MTNQRDEYVGRHRHDDDRYVSSARFLVSLDKEMRRWGPLMERLKPSDGPNHLAPWGLDQPRS